MYVARILFPVQVLGPGNRIGIWLCGCPHRCDGCSNPELWNFQERYHTSVDTVLSMVRSITSQVPINGFTITGGDPFYQYDELIELMEALAQINADILVYTGYTLDQLAEKDLSSIAVLIDGPYIKERNTNVPLRGSDNQVVHILKEEYRATYEAYLATMHNQIQNFTTTDGVVSVGIHQPDFSYRFDSLIKECYPEMQSADNNSSKEVLI